MALAKLMLLFTFLFCFDQACDVPAEGSFLEDCDECTVTEVGDKCILTCQCFDNKRIPRYAQLDITNCGAESISNSHGRMYCDLHEAICTLPTGNYEESCFDCENRNCQLFCRCKTPDENRAKVEVGQDGSQTQYYNSFITLKICNGQTIHNLLGNLSCKNLENKYCRDPPLGTYTDTCTNCFVNQNTCRMFCQCNKVEFGIAVSTIELLRCRDEIIYNNDGQLACDAVKDELGCIEPRGDYSNSCTGCQFDTDSCFLACSICPSVAGMNLSSTLSLRECSNSYVNNVNGKLTCAHFENANLLIGQMSNLIGNHERNTELLN